MYLSIYIIHVHSYYSPKFLRAQFHDICEQLIMKILPQNLFELKQLIINFDSSVVQGFVQQVMCC